MPKFIFTEDMASKLFPTFHDSDLTHSIVRQKLVILGDAAVGKTAIRKVLSNEPFPEAYRMTPDVEFSLHNVQNISEKVNVEQYIFEIPGNSSLFHQGGDYFESCFQHVDIICLVYNVCQNDTFRGLVKWLKYAKGFCTSAGTKIFVIANQTDRRRSKGESLSKCDSLRTDDNGSMEVHVESNSNDVSDFCEEHGLELFECSAYLNADHCSVKTIFEDLASRSISYQSIIAGERNEN